MLKTSEERIKLLKTGFTQKQIEEMYIEGNDFKIVFVPIMVDIVEIEARQNKNTCETAVGSVHSLGLAVASIFNVSRFKRFSPIIQ
jgi:hypothetical protein